MSHVFIQLSTGSAVQQPSGDFFSKAEKTKSYEFPWFNVRIGWHGLFSAEISDTSCRFFLGTPIQVKGSTIT